VRQRSQAVNPTTQQYELPACLLGRLGVVVLDV
jgi:hypothetical protein